MADWRAAPVISVVVDEGENTTSPFLRVTSKRRQHMMDGLRLDGLGSNRYA